MAVFGAVVIILLTFYFSCSGTAFESNSSDDGATDDLIYPVGRFTTLPSHTRLHGIVEFNTFKSETLPVFQIRCLTGFIYDKTKDVCVKEKQNTQNVTEYKMKLLVDNSNLIDQQRIFKIPGEWRNLARGFQSFIQRLAEAANVSVFSYSVGVFKEVPHWWQLGNPISVPLYLSVSMQVSINDSSREHYTMKVVNRLGDHIPVNVKGKVINTDFKLFNGSYDTENIISLFPDEDSGDCCFPMNKSINQEDIRVVSEELVFYEMSCPYVQLTEEDGYVLVDGGLKLIFDDSDQTSNIVKETYTFHGDDMITICADIYEKYLSEKPRNPIGSSKWTVIVTFLSLSLLCLFLTFATYCMFPSLRTIPAKNNIGLILCLFMAQMVYINGFLRTENSLLCQILGISLHYFWLAAILWMNVCCFHVFKGFVLSKTISSGPTRSCSIMFRYFLYANGLSFIIVSAVVTTKLVLSDGQETGYGGTFCFLSTVLLNGLTVVLPLCVVLLSNFVFFAATIYTINHTKQIRRNTGGDRKNIWIYIKLSSITGLFWVVAILSAALDMEPLEYISIVLNSSQGAFLFISFCCNKRIVRLWKNRLSGRKGQPGHGTTESGRSMRTKETEITEFSVATDNMR